MSTELKEIALHRTPGLDLYRDVDGTERDVQNILRLGTSVAEELGIGRVWMVSGSEHATAEAELIPSLCRLLSLAGVDSRWLVVKTDDHEALAAAKAISDRLYGAAGEEEGSLEAHREAFRRISGEVAQALRSHAEPRDLVVVHGVLPAGLAEALDDPAWRRLLWTPHAGSPPTAPGTREAWEFLQPWLEPYARCLFSEQRFAPAFLRSRSAVVTPGIDPLSEKNREMRPYELIDVLRAAGLVDRPGQAQQPTFRRPVKVARGNSWKAEPIPSLMFKPLVVQIARFDRQRGCEELMEAFHHLLKVYRERLPAMRVVDERVIQELENVELVLAGPDPDDLPHDPAAQEVAKQLGERHAALPPEVARRVHILRLPVADREENAQTVNVLQRLAAVVVCNARHRGFGIPVAEALWKKTPVVASKAGSVSLLIRPETDGLVVDDPNDRDAVAMALLQTLGNRLRAESFGRSGHKRVVQNFLVLHSLQALLGELEKLLTGAGVLGPREVPASSARPARIASAS